MLNAFQPNEKRLRGLHDPGFDGEAGRLYLEVYPGWVESNIAVIYDGDMRNAPVI